MLEITSNTPPKNIPLQQNCTLTLDAEHDEVARRNLALDDAVRWLLKASEVRARKL